MNNSKPHPRLAMHSIAASLTLAVLLGQTPCSEAAVVSAGFQFSIDQNLIIFDGKANRKNLQAAIDDGATGLQESLDIAMSNDLMLASMWIPYTSVLGMREHPGLFLSNNTDSNANIVSMEITLADNSNAFMPFENGGYVQKSLGSGEYIQFTNMNTYEATRVDPDQVSIAANVFEGGQRLSLSFDNGGIRPGRATTFNIYSSTGMNLEDFFDENTQIEVTYEDSDTGELISSGFLGLSDIQNFNDELVEQVRGGLNGIHFSSSVDAFSFTSPLTGIPEPSSLFLLNSALGIILLRRRRAA